MYSGVNGDMGHLRQGTMSRADGQVLTVGQSLRVSQMEEISCP